MIIKRSQLFYMIAISYAVCCIICTLLFISIDYILVPALVPIYLITVSEIISIGRTFILDETGCTVCFGKYFKKYTWDQLKTKVIVNYYIPSMYSNSLYPPYVTEIFFVPYKMRKPKMIRAGLYRVFHPWRCIFMYFIPKEDGDYPGRYYEVDEQEFRTKMAQWGVELIEL